MSGPAQRYLAEPGRAGSGALVLVMALLLAALVGWMAWATVEEVVRAPGRVEPAGQVRLVGHPHGGRVAGLAVRDGDAVTPGQLLLELDGAVLAAERLELESRLALARDVALRLRAESATGGAAPAGVGAEQAALMAARAAALAERRTVLDQALAARRGDLATARAERQRVLAGLGHLEAQLGSIRELAARGLYPRLRLATAEKQLADARGERAKAETALATAEANLAEAEARRRALDEEWRRDLLADLADATAEVQTLSERLAVVAARLDDLKVLAPVAGVVTDLAVSGPGQSVAASQTLLRLVPQGEALTVEAAVRNEDIGRVRPAMPATVKVLAFDWLRFGALEGSVARVPADATTDAATGEARYRVEVRTRQQDLGPGRPITPGMLVDVELHVGERTILSYLTERIWRVSERAFREG